MWANMDSAPTFLDNDYCFACGSKNPLGLQLSFYREGDFLCTRVRPFAHWQGFAGVVHGGLQATILDDLMSNYLRTVHGLWGTTAELSLRFRQPVPLDQELVFKATLQDRQSKVWTIRAFCQLADDETGPKLTTGVGRFFLVHQPVPTAPARRSP